MSKEKRRLVEELHAPARRNFPRRRVVVHGFDDLWQADLAEMQPYARVNSGHKYILTIIDVFSKYAWALPVKTKSAKDVTNAFSKAIATGRKPKNLQTDNGKEFYNTDFQKLMRKHAINHYSTYSTMKASVVERFNRTLKTEMWKIFTLIGNYKWLSILPKLVDDYNGRVHRTIRMRPVDVTPENADVILSTAYNHAKIAPPGKFKINDRVRVSKHKTLFAKGYTPNWSTEIFKIRKVQRTNPVTYLLQDLRGNEIQGGFCEHELIHSVANPDVYLVEKVLRRKGNKVYVKWLGFDASHNSWIERENVL